MIVLADSKISNRGMVEQNVPPQLKSSGRANGGSGDRDGGRRLAEENAYGLPSGYD